MILQSVQERRGRCTCCRRHSASARGVSVCLPGFDSISTNGSQRHRQKSLTAAHKFWEVHPYLSQLSGHQSPKQLTCTLLGRRTQTLIELCCTCPMQVLGTPEIECRYILGASHCTYLYLFLLRFQSNMVTMSPANVTVSVSVTITVKCVCRPVAGMLLLRLPVRRWGEL